MTPENINAAMNLMGPGGGGMGGPGAMGGMPGTFQMPGPSSTST